MTYVAWLDFKSWTVFGLFKIWSFFNILEIFWLYLIIYPEIVLCFYVQSLAPWLYPK